KIWHEYLGELTHEITVTPKTETPLSLDLKDLLAAKSAPAGNAAASVVSGVVGKGDSTAKPANEVIVQMHEMGDSAGTIFRFEPANLTIKVGTTVKWVNTSGDDGPRHTSTDDPEWETPQTPAVLPAGAQKW